MTLQDSFLSKVHLYVIEEWQSGLPVEFKKLDKELEDCAQNCVSFQRAVGTHLQNISSQSVTVIATTYQYTLATGSVECRVLE